MNRRRTGLFYGWWVLAGAVGMGLLALGAANAGFRAFLLPAVTELDISRTQLSYAVSVASAVGSLAALGGGWLSDRYGGRRLVLLGGLLICAGFAVGAFVNAFWQLAAYLMIISVGRGIGYVSLLTMINQWFVRRKALALTVLLTVFVVGNYGAGLSLPDASEADNWTETILVVSILLLATTAVAALVIRSCPEDIGERPDGDPPPADPSIDNDAVAADLDGNRQPRERDAAYTAADLTLRSTLRTPAFWLLATAVTVQVASASALGISYTLIMLAEGKTLNEAAVYISMISWGFPFLRFGMGLSTMVVPVRWVLFGGMAVGAVGTAIMLAWSGNGAIGLFLLSRVVAVGIQTLGWLAVGEYFGRRSFGTLVGIMMVCSEIGGFAAPAALSWLFDWTDGYDVLLAALTVLQLAAGLCYLMARRPTPSPAA